MLLTLGASFGASACRHMPVLEMATESLSLAFTGSAPYPRSRAEVEALPYAQLGVRHGRGPRAILVLAERVDGELRWVSSDRALIATRGQRIVRTVGLPRDLRAARPTGPDLMERYEPGTAASANLRVRTLVDVSPGEQFNIPVSSRFEVEGAQTIEVLGERIDTLRVREEVECETWRWQATNRHWLSLHNALAWRSQQYLLPGEPPLELEVLKRPA